MARNTWQHHRARLAYLSRTQPDNVLALEAERTAMRVAKIGADVARAAENIPTDDRPALAVALLGAVLPASAEVAP